MKFTDNRIKNLKPSLSGRKDCFLFDDETPHLGVRVSAKSKRFVFQARLEGGGQYRKTLGVFPALTVDEARRVTKVLTGKLAGGADLREERAAKQAKRDQARADAALTLGRLIDQWEVAHKPKRRPNYVKGTADGLRRAHARLLDRPANSIRAEEIEKGWESLTSQPAAAHMAGVRMRTLFRWAVKTRKLDSDPTKQVVLAEKTQARDRELSGSEARAVWKAAGSLPMPYGGFVRFLMSSGVRIREAAGACWGEFNADFSEWTIPSSRMKVKLKHVVPLPQIVREMLAGLPRFAASNLVFTRDGKRAVTGFSDLKDRLDEVLANENLEPWTFHDFRRSVVGWLVRNGVDSLVADKLLAHTRTSKLNAVAAMYNHYDFLKERTDALQRWVAFLAGEESEASPSPSEPLMLPAPPPPPAPSVEAPPPVILQLTGVKEQEEALEEHFADLILRITSRADVIRANSQILKQHAFAPKFLATLGPQSAPHEIAIATLTHLAALSHLEGITVFKQREVETQRAKMTEEVGRWRNKAERSDLEAEQARAIGEGEFAARAEAEARRARTIAGLWEMPLQTMMAVSDVCVVGYRKGDPQLKDHRALGVYRMLLLQTEKIFGKPEPETAAVYATAATGVEMSRFRARQVVRDGKVGSPKCTAR
jgi:integrase